MPDEYRISAVQKRQLSDIFKACSLNLSDFIVDDGVSSFGIKHKQEYYFITISRTDRDTYETSYLRSDRVNPPRVVVKTWELTLKLFKDWSDEIYKELNTPTGWESYQQAYPFEGQVKNESEVFSEQDKIYIKQGLLFIAEQIQEQNLMNAEQFELTNKKLIELGNKVDQLSKFDWIALFMGTVVSLIQYFALPEQSAGSLMKIIKDAFEFFKLNP